MLKKKVPSVFTKEKEKATLVVAFVCCGHSALSLSVQTLFSWAIREETWALKGGGGTCLRSHVSAIEIIQTQISSAFFALLPARWILNNWVFHIK